MICESIAVRYSIVGERHTNDLEGMYGEICTSIRGGNGTLPEIFNANVLSLVPSDEVFREKLATMEIKARVSAWRSILTVIYNSEGTGETSISGSDKVHIEHILPQNPTPKALKEAGFNSLDEALDYIPRIGNLTFLSTQKNMKASNKPFSEKKELYNESDIPMTKALTRHQSWSADLIDQRSKELADIAVRAFRDPVKIAEGL